MSTVCSLGIPSQMSTEIGGQKGQHLVNVVKECPLKLQKLMNYLSKTHTYLGNYKTDNAPSEFISTNCVVL